MLISLLYFPYAVIIFVTICSNILDVAVLINHLKLRLFNLVVVDKGLFRLIHSGFFASVGRLACLVVPSKTTYFNQIQNKTNLLLQNTLNIITGDN